MYIEEIAKSIINSEHGWAVAEQFESSFNNQTIEIFHEQNPNALNYIKNTVYSIIDSGAFNETIEDELRAYITNMEHALTIAYVNEDSVDEDYE
jgi:hypothetical protein